MGFIVLRFRVEGLGLRVLGFRAWGCRNSGTYRGTSLTRKRTPLGPYRRPMLRVLGGSERGGYFLIGVVPLYTGSKIRRTASIPDGR